MIQQIYHCKNKGQKREIYILATEIYPFGKNEPSMYGDILALFNTLEEAEEVRGKLERRETVDFIDMEAVMEYDHLVIFSLPLNEKIGTKLAIFLCGGLVQGIISNKPLLRPIIIDYDTEGYDEANGDNVIEWVWEGKSGVCDREGEAVVMEPELEVNSTLVDYLYGLYYGKDKA